MNKYIIPANSKKSKLILGLFTGVDLAIFVVGVIFAVVLFESEFPFDALNEKVTEPV